MTSRLPSSVLFCCNYNAVRSPMAEGIMKKLYGDRVYVQSAGVRGELEVDGFSVAVCEEIGVRLSEHRVRTMDEMEGWGDDLSSFELIVCLSPAAQRRAILATVHFSTAVEYWPILDPTGMGETRETKLTFYRQSRDQILDRLIDRFGDPPQTANESGETTPDED